MDTKKRISIKMITTLGLLVAIEIILTRFFSIQSWNIRIGFGFIPIVIAAVLYGPIESAVVAGVADIIGAILFPFGAFFIGFTITSILTGLIYGFFLRKKQNMKNILGAVLLNQIIGSLLLNTYWISITSGASFQALLYTRIIQFIVLTTVQIVVLTLFILPQQKVINNLRKIVS